MKSGDEHREIVVRLSISRKHLLKLYRGTASQILAVADNGQRVQFPARALRPYISHEGIDSVFTLLIDSNNKLIRVKKNPD